MIAVLHTWGRNLSYHPHVHYLVPGEGITDEMKKVRFSEDNFLVHVRPLSIIFKAKFRDAFKAKAPDLFNKIRPNTWKRAWVVHIKAVGSGDKALEYMGRYLFRVAISKNRIIRLHNAKVTFRYTDYKSGKNRIVTVDAFEFIRRFLQHVLPHNFMKVRYYGFLAPASRKKLAGLRKILFMDEKPQNDTHPKVMVKTLLCPVCGSQLVWVRTLHRGADHDP